MGLRMRLEQGSHDICDAYTPIVFCADIHMIRFSPDCGFWHLVREKASGGFDPSVSDRKQAIALLDSFSRSR